MVENIDTKTFQKLWDDPEHYVGVGRRFKDEEIAKATENKAWHLVKELVAEIEKLETVYYYCKREKDFKGRKLLCFIVKKTPETDVLLRKLLAQLQLISEGKYVKATEGGFGTGVMGTGRVSACPLFGGD